MQQKTWFRTLQRWRFPLSAIFDSFFWYGAFFVAVLARLDFTVANVDVASLLQVATIAALVQLTTGIATGLYRGRRTIASFGEVRLVVFSTFVATGVTFAVVAITGPPNLVPLSTVFAAGAYQLLGALGTRYLGRLVVEINTRSTHARPHRTLIFGAGSAGDEISRALLQDPHTDLDPVAFLDDDPTKRRLVVNGIRVVGTRNNIAAAARAFDADTLLLAFPGARQESINTVVDLGQAANLAIKIIPSVRTLTGPTARITDIRDLELSDFLNRDEVDIDDAGVRALVSGKRVLVTGAGGSIGSVLCRTILTYEPARLIMVDHDENALHRLQLGIEGRALLESPDLVLCDVRDRDAVRTVFESTHPDIVFHAAAHKHVTFLERFPSEGLKTNVGGTTNVLMAASETGVERFINISTDKAADPVNVL
ncbi:MAG: polysaccharide biosynthesis protein, partial [Actinomycetota bacterium]|nr:polysaccharide biosynthesis protein [Actinomycetota bacterium]